MNLSDILSSLRHMTTNTQVKIVKFGALVVSTSHLVFVYVEHNSPIIAIIAGLTLGAGEYLLSQHYASFLGKRRRALESPRKQKETRIEHARMAKILLWSLVIFSTISFVANLQYHAQKINLTLGFGPAQLWQGFQVLLYSGMLPAIVIAMSLIDIPSESDDPPEGGGKARRSLDRLSSDGRRKTKKKRV